MKPLTLTDWLTIVIFVLSPYWNKWVENHESLNTKIMSDIFPFIVTGGMAVYLIKRFSTLLKKQELKYRWMQLFAYAENGNPYAVDAYAFQKLYSDKELKLLGFTEQEIDTLRGSIPGVYLSEIMGGKFSRISNQIKRPQ